MQNVILPSLAVMSAIFSTSLQAQPNRAFAVTSETVGTFKWNAVREIDLNTGEVINTFYDQSKSKNFAIERTGKLDKRLGTYSNLNDMPMADGVAATAYDAKNNRLYYTTMRGTDLRYFDLNSTEGKVVYNQEQQFVTGSRLDEANVITRMTFAADGYGYAITNDGKHLMRFTTDQKPVVTQLGALIDGKSNGTISVHNLCSSWGGDMVGDAYGNLYLISMHNYIFKINPQTLIADLLGQVKGLPATFTSNGAAVDNDGQLFLSSSTFTDTYYRVNISTLNATPLKVGSGTPVFNSSDLANANLLYQYKGAPIINRPGVLGNRAVSVYPNPVKSKNFTVQFDKVPAGRYNVLLTDASGRNVLTKMLTIGLEGQIERITLPRASAGGIYLLKLNGDNNTEVFSNKIVVE